jgi:uncharacterized protein (DUF2141 family)
MRIPVLCILFSLFLYAFAQEQTPVTGRLLVILKGFENHEGEARLALCPSRENFEADEQAFRSAIVPVSRGTAIVELDSIPEGFYAIKVYHDENENGELDTNFLGAPSEVYGYSNNARGTFGPADWEDAKFKFSLPADTIMILLK